MTNRPRSGDDVFSNDGPRGRPSRVDPHTAPVTAVVTMVGEVDLRSLETGTWRLHVVGNRNTASFLLDDGEHVIGRSGDVSVRLDEDSISRRHALLVVNDDHLSITDLGSLNGTKVRERVLKPNQAVSLSPGESFELGSVMLVIQRRRQAERPRRRVYDHSYFENRVDEEIARRAAAAARRRGDDSGATVRAVVGAGLTLCRLHVDSAEGHLDDGLIEETLEAALPAGVIVAEYAPGELELMFTDMPWNDVEDACEDLRETFGTHKARIRTGFAIFPRDGRTASSLLSVANGKLSTEQELEVRPLSDSGRGKGDEAPLTAMERLTRLVERVADSDISIIIHGETGVGKEVMAKEVHRLSPRTDKPFVGLNCAALTETLLESELFGHERGAFSGAVNTKPGLFEVADKGTVFLDEIGEMSLSIQAKLLRVLEERQVLRVGGLSPRSIDVRFLAASHKDLESEVTAGRFRQDLYFRLNGITVEIPPLRERVGEIEGLCLSFIADACRRNKRSEVPTLSREATSLLARYSWPGNIRELRNIMERAVLLCTGPRITAEHLPVERLQRHRVTSTPSPAQLSSPTAPPRPASTWRGPEAPRSSAVRPSYPEQRRISDDDDDDAQTRPAIRRARQEDFSRARPDDDMDMLPTLPPGARTADSLKEAVSDLERQRIIDALRTCGGNQTKAAEMLGISRRTLVNRLDQYDLPRPRK